jgi:cation diffusion facilitator CzcD-associated flavoprotein CzcO
MVWFSLSSDSHDWPHSHGYSADIQAYWVGLTRKYDLYPRIRLNTKVVLATWDNYMKLYHIDVENVLTGEKYTFDAEVVVSAIGILEVPRFPNIPGRESFKGKMWHSAIWNHEVDLKGKKVAVIGNGASAYVEFLVNRI